MGNTIGEILISYDINKSHTDVKKSMISKGYNDSFKFQGETKTYYLPNTTLWHPKKSSNMAINDLQSICNGLGVVLEKAVAVKASEFKGI